MTANQPRARGELARLTYAMRTKRREYTDQARDYYEKPYRQRVLHNLSKPAQQFGVKIVAI